MFPEPGTNADWLKHRTVNQCAEKPSRENVTSCSASGHFFQDYQNGVISKKT